MTVTTRRGTKLRCRNQQVEALLRLLENVLEVGKRPEELVVYASIGRAVKDWGAYRRIVDALQHLGKDRALMPQTERPVAVLGTHTAAPVMVSAVNNTMRNWATEERLYSRLAEHEMTWGGLTAAVWQYIDRQGVLGGTYELLHTALGKHFRKPATPHHWVLTAGLGGMGSSRPISARMLELSALMVEADPAKLTELRAADGIDLATDDLDDAPAAISAAITERRSVAVGLLDNAADVFPAMVTNDARPNAVTDQTTTHGTRYGYLPSGYTLESWAETRKTDPEKVEHDAHASMAVRMRAILALRQHGSMVFESGNNLKVQASYILGEAERQRVFAEIPGSMEGYLQPLFSRDIRPFRWMILSGDDSDLTVADGLAATMLPGRPEIARWIGLVRHHILAQGLPTRSRWLGYRERSALALTINEAVTDGRISAPVAFSHDHLDTAGMTHPRIDTEDIRDDFDGMMDWSIPDAILLATGGVGLVAVRSGGDGYSGRMQSTGATIVAGGTEAAAARLRQALDLDSGLKVVRHATAGYENALDAVKRSHRPSTHGTPLSLIRD